MNLSELNFEDLPGDATQARCYATIRHKDGQTGTGIPIYVQKIKDEDSSQEHDSDTYFFGLLDPNGLPFEHSLLPFKLPAFGDNDDYTPDAGVSEILNLHPQWCFASNPVPHMIGPFNSNQASAFLRIIQLTADQNHFRHELGQSTEAKSAATYRLTRTYTPVSYETAEPAIK